MRIVRSTGAPAKFTLAPVPAYQAELVSSFTLSDNNRGPMQKLPDGTLVIGASLYEPTGNLRATLDPRLLGLGEVGSLAWIGSGPWAGSWVMTDANESAVVIFDWQP